MSGEDRPKQRSGHATTPVRLGRDEMNLAEFPIGLISERSRLGVKTLEFSDTIVGETGEQVERRWTITGGDKYGLPVAADEQVYIALMEVTREHGFKSRTVPITRYDLIRRMGWSDDGRSYARVRAALDRLQSVSIRAENAFWDNEQREYVTVAFGIIDNYALYDERPSKRARRETARQIDLPLSSITWNEVIFNSFIAGNLKYLDTALYFSLDSAISRRLFRYLDKKRYPRKRTFQIGVRKLAFEHLGLSRNYYPSQIKRELDRAHAELQEVGYLESVAYEPMSDGDEEKVIYRFASARRKPQKRLPTPAHVRVADKLTQLGVTGQIAAKLVREYTLEEIEVQIGCLPYRDADDPAAVLVKSIRERWMPPAAYYEELIAQEKRREAEARHRSSQQRSEEARARWQLEERTIEQLQKTIPQEELRELLRQAENRVHERVPLLRERTQSLAYKSAVHDAMRELLQERYPEEYKAVREQVEHGASNK